MALSVHASLGEITSLSEVNRLLHETIAKERAVDQELDRLLGKRSELERSFLLLNAPTAEMLELVGADCEQLLSSVQGTAHLAEHISSKVRTLDTVQGRVSDTLSVINLILDRTNCINGVQSAMDSEDYEAAADFIARFMDLEARLAAAAVKRAHSQDCDAGMAAAAAAAVDAGQAESQRQVLLAAKVRLEGLVEQRFEDAVARRDKTAAVRFARLFKPLSKQEEGLKRFVEYLHLVAAAAARQNYDALDKQLEQAPGGMAAQAAMLGASAAARGAKQPARVDFAAALSLLFKDIAVLVEEHEPFVRDTFGPAAVLDLITGMQSELDTHGTRLLQRYAEARRVDRVAKEAGTHRAGGSGARRTDGPGGLDPRQAEWLIEELLRLCQLAEEWSRFALGKMRDAATAAGGALSAAREASFRSGSFAVAVRELLGYYSGLEEFYMDECTSMAVRIDEVVPGGLTSSMVDDVFFVLRKSGVRALATGSVQCTAALLAELNNVLANAFRNALQGRLSVGPSRLLAAGGPVDGSGAMGLSEGGAAASAAAASEFAIALNNADVSAEYVGKLRAELEGHALAMYQAQGDRDRIKSVLADLSKTAGDFRTAVTRAAEQLSEALMPRLRPALDEVAAASYTLTESEYAALEAGEGWAHRLLAAVELAVMWTQPLLTTNNYEGLLHLLLDKLVAKLEALLGRKQFNQLGGLQLDRDVRLLVSHLGELTSRTVRDKFARLTQMALVLGLETADELLDYWGAGDAASHITWRLTPAELRSVLSQRSDFTREAILALPLG